MEQMNWMAEVQDTIDVAFEDIDPGRLLELGRQIAAARRIFLMGQGRTGLVVEMFGMRLAQLGLPVHIISQPTTPALTKDDLAVFVSGSGETPAILAAAARALDIGADCFAVSQVGDSSLGNLVDQTLIIPSPLKPTKVLNGTLFEMALLISFDALVYELLQITGQGFEEISARHANLG